MLKNLLINLITAKTNPKVCKLQINEIIQIGI